MIITILESRIKITLRILFDMDPSPTVNLILIIFACFDFREFDIFYEV